MREILFRGKTLSSEWIYGHLLNDGFNEPKDITYYILPEDTATFLDFEEVITDTIGQFTGLWDDRGVKVYEGDILKFKNGNIGQVKFENAMFVVHNYYCSHQDDPTNAFSENAAFYIIGNIHDNPELI